MQIHTLNSSAAKTGFGRNSRQTKSSPERGGSCLQRDCFLCSKNHIGTRKCSKFVVRALKMAVFRGFRGHFGANSGSAMADEQDFDHTIPSLSLKVL